LLILEQCAIFWLVYDEKHKKIFLEFLIWQQTFLGFEEIRCFTILILASPEKFTTTNFTKKKIFFVKSRISCHQSRLVRFWSIIFIYGLSDIGLNWIPNASISRKKKYFVFITQPIINYPPQKKSQRFSGKKQIKTTRVSSAFRRRKKNQWS
jgi:hypothetical protein